MPRASAFVSSLSCLGCRLLASRRSSRRASCRPSPRLTPEDTRASCRAQAPRRAPLPPASSGASGAVLNLGPDTARGGPNTARAVLNTARGGPGARNSPAALSSSAGSLPPVPPPTLLGALLSAPARVTPSAGFDALGFRVPSAVPSAIPSAVSSTRPAAGRAPSSEWDALGPRAAAPVRAAVGAALATPPSTPQRHVGRDLGTEPTAVEAAAPSSVADAASSSATMPTPRTPDRVQPPPSMPVHSPPSNSRRPTTPNLLPGTTPARSQPPSTTPSTAPESGALVSVPVLRARPARRLRPRESCTVSVTEGTVVSTRMQSDFVRCVINKVTFIYK